MPESWHVYFFARPLTVEDKVAFDALVANVFSAAVRVVHDDSGPVAEFRAKTPTDEPWFRKNLAAFTTFSGERVPIVSYQGTRFGPFGLQPGPTR